MLSIVKQVMVAVALAMVVGCTTYRGELLEPPPLASTADDANSIYSLSGQELWIITAETPMEFHNEGALDEHRFGDGEIVCENSKPIQLERTDVKVQITGFLAVTTVNQTFCNRDSAAGAAYYKFSLPRDAAVNDFTMTIGQRHIRGIVRPKEDADRIYLHARDNGITATLLGEYEPGVFYGRLGKLEAGKSLNIQIVCAHTLQYHDGWLQYKCCANATASLMADIESGEPTDGIKVEGFQAGMVRDNDGVIVRQMTPHSAEVEIPVHYFRVRTDMTISYRLARRGSRAMYVRQSDQSGGGYAALMVTGDDPTPTPRVPIRLTLLLHKSAFLTASTDFANDLLRGLDERDQFQIVFTSQKPGEAQPLQRGKVDLPAALRELYTVVPGDSGSSSLLEHIRAISDAAPAESPAMIPWLVILSDDGNVDLSAAMKTMREHLGNYRLAIVAPPTPTDGFQLRAIASGAGGVLVLPMLPNTSNPATAADHLLACMTKPSLTQLSIDWNSAQVDDIFPSRNLDVFPERPLVLMAHCKSAPPASIMLHGYANGKAVSIPVTAIAADAPGIDRLWARRKMADLAGQYVAGGDDTLLKQITQVALDHGMVSPFTSILLVDAAQRAPAP